MTYIDVSLVYGLILGRRHRQQVLVVVVQLDIAGTEKTGLALLDVFHQVRAAFVPGQCRLAEGDEALVLFEVGLRGLFEIEAVLLFSSGKHGFERHFRAHGFFKRVGDEVGRLFGDLVQEVEAVRGGLEALCHVLLVVRVAVGGGRASTGDARIFGLAAGTAVLNSGSGLVRATEGPGAPRNKGRKRALYVVGVAFLPSLAISFPHGKRANQ